MTGKQYRSHRRYGVFVAPIVLVESGNFGVYLQFKSKLYDYAAFSLIFQEVGIDVMNSQGEEWNIDDDDFIAVHPSLTEIVKDHLKDLHE